MKKLFLVIAGCLLLTAGANAQKVSQSDFSNQRFALVDLEYILNKIPAFDLANSQLELLSQKWQQEVEAQMQAVQTLYKNYQTEVVFLSNEMKTARENEIVAKEKEAQELRNKYFGPEGELFKRRESLIKPIQDDIYNAIKAISDENGLQMVLDRASSANIIFASPRIDISDMVLQRLGF
ncbi:MAG: OmpH family outer membrane protein [Prevotellaceae bacterium]|jgi:outer membrane protein|nr:OmpH family outer membrane protein [Prevotellaceae bacterium]